MLKVRLINNKVAQNYGVSEFVKANLGRVFDAEKTKYGYEIIWENDKTINPVEMYFPVECVEEL